MSIASVKALSVTGIPVLLFDCTTVDGQVHHWSTRAITVAGSTYEPRVLQHSRFEVRAIAEDTSDGLSQITLVCGNADQVGSQIEQAVGWKGAQLVVTFLFCDAGTGAPSSETQVLFQGVANPPDEINDEQMQLSFQNPLYLQRTVLPSVRIQRRCPWTFPATAAQRVQAADQSEANRFNVLAQCGYSPDQPNGAGNLLNGQPYTSCDYSRSSCVARGMFAKDQSGKQTARFGGVEFVPPSILVRANGARDYALSAVAENEAKYNDFVPLLYGTCFYTPPICFARNDGNLTHYEVLLGMGEMNRVVRVLANDIEIPAGTATTKPTATGWYNVVSTGQRVGTFNLDFNDGKGNALGDPYGGMALMSLVLPNKMLNGNSLPRLKVLAQGVKVATFGPDGSLLSTQFTSNPAWVLLDALRRAGVPLARIDTKSFAATAPFFETSISTVDGHGNAVSVAPYLCNLVLDRRKTAFDVIRGIRMGAGLLLRLNAAGLVETLVEGSIGLQQANSVAGSNATTVLNGGWPAYEFGDGTTGVGDIARRGLKSSVRLQARPTADSPNRYSLEFQDCLNEYQQDSYSLVDADDVRRSGQEIALQGAALGVAHFVQASKVATLALRKAVLGNRNIEFETSVRGVHLRPGDLITVTLGRYGMSRQLFRIRRVVPDPDYAVLKIEAQIHNDNWYAEIGSTPASSAGRQPDYRVGAPRPLLGSALNANGSTAFAVTESDSANDSVQLSVGFLVPSTPTPNKVGIPVLSWQADIVAGGQLDGGRLYYYAVSAVSTDGSESDLSFLVQVQTPVGPRVSVRLNGISTGPEATKLRVYRGLSSNRLLLAQELAMPVTQIVDAGTGFAAVAAPDRNFDHAQFDWRWQLLPPVTADVATATGIGKQTLGMVPNEYAGKIVHIVSGTGAGQEAVILSNTATVLTVASWASPIDATSVFAICESSWQSAGASRTSPLRFAVPDRAASSIEIRGVAVNSIGVASTQDADSIVSWTLSPSSGDYLVPGAPSFGLSVDGTGRLLLGSIGFSSLTNTSSIESMTAVVSYVEEKAAVSCTLLAAVDGQTTTMRVSAALSTPVWAQIESEVVWVASQVNDTVTVVRGAKSSAAAAHAANAKLYVLSQRTEILSFPQHFFGSSASGSYQHGIGLPAARIGAVDLFATNSVGNGLNATVCVTNTVDGGLRTLRGGQYSLQVPGRLGVQQNAALPLVVDQDQAPRDITCFVASAPGSAIALTVTVGGLSYCSLTVPSGQTRSNVVNGFGLPPLRAGSVINVNVDGVSTTAGVEPGTGLTVVIRL